MTPTPEPYRAPEASRRYVLESVRAADRGRFLATLFAPEPSRADLLALLAFDHELSRTRVVAREPVLARIRLEWWRQAAAEAAGTARPRAQPVVESLSETVRRHGLESSALIALIDAREEEIDGPLDARRVGQALADLQLRVLGANDQASRAAARAVAAAWLMEEGPERSRLIAEARALRRDVDPSLLPILLPARLLDRRVSPWRRPLMLWWAARCGRW